MQKFFFDAVATVTYSLIWCSDRVFGVPSAVLVWLAQRNRVLLANVGFFIMQTIDPARAKQVEAEGESDPFDLGVQAMELKLLSSSYQVRDDARRVGGWTDLHSDAIEAIGTALLLDIGWEEEDVHSHLRSVVESIDGFTYKSFRDD